MIVLHSPSQTAADPAFAHVTQRVEALVKAIRRSRASPRRQPAYRSAATGTRRSSRRRRAQPEADGAAPPTASKAARNARHRDGVTVNPTGASGMWSDFNTANRTAMMKSRAVLLAGHAGDPGARVRLAGRRRPAADAHHRRPGRLRRGALPRHAAAGHLDLGDELRADVRARAGHRLRALHRRPLPRRATSAAACHRPRPRRVTMDTAGKAVLFSGITVLISLSAVMLVPSPRSARWRSASWSRSSSSSPPRSRCCRPCWRARAAGRQRSSLPVGALGRAPLAALRRAGPSACGASPLALRRPRAARAARARRSRSSASRPACRRSRSSRPATARASATPRCRRRSAPARRARCRSSPRSAEAAARHRDRQGRPRHRARSCPTQTSSDGRYALVQAIPAPEPLRPRRRPHHRPPAHQPSQPARSSAARRPRTTTSRRRCRQATPLVIGVVLALGFLLLLVALQAPIIAARRRAHQPARHRRRLRRRPADLPGRPRLPACSASSRRASWTPGGRCSSSR